MYNPHRPLKGSYMFYKRNLINALRRFSKFPIVALLGPRQSGKTTLVKHVFPKHTFVNLENPDLREFASKDPEGFLHEYENGHGLILDEIQYVPHILPYLQLIVDEKKRPGYFVITGSQNFLMNQAITQSLAGRVGILTLLPLSNSELIKNKLASKNSTEIILKGGYPRLYSDKFAPDELYPSYIQSYLERDVRQLVNIGNISTFQKFMQLCAGRIGQLLNINELATHCGIHRKTVEEWLSTLEASYILFLLKPYFRNYNKRIVKSPKLFFYDTGIACSLLNIRNTNDLTLSPFRGPLFENFIITDFMKQFYNQGIRPPLYFWRDLNGRIEIDCLIDLGSKQIPIEIKSGKTVISNFFKNLTAWNKLTQSKPANSYLVYAGALSQKRNTGNVRGWQSASHLITQLEQKK